MSEPSKRQTRSTQHSINLQRLLLLQVSNVSKAPRLLATLERPHCECTAYNELSMVCAQFCLAHSYGVRPNGSHGSNERHGSVWEFSSSCNHSRAVPQRPSKQPSVASIMVLLQMACKRWFLWATLTIQNPPKKYPTRNRAHYTLLSAPMYYVSPIPGPIGRVYAKSHRLLHQFFLNLD